MTLPGFYDNRTQNQALVAPTQGGGGWVSAGTDCRDAPLFGPYGVCGVPPEGSEALLLPLDDAYACAGLLCDAAGLLPGEVRLRSAGGAELLLCNDGTIHINGLTITADGQLIQK